MAQNTTGLSFLGVVKWLLVIASLPCFVKAWQGSVGRETATGYGRSDPSTTMLLTGADAVKYGLLNLLYAALLLAAAWAIWYFWQQYED
jgi:hypothetical protein